MKKQLLYVLPFVLAIAACNLFNDYGKKVSVGKSEVFYKGDGVTQAEAEKLGSFLLKNKLFDSTKESSAQITRDSGSYIVHLVMDSKTMEPSVRLNMWKLQPELSNEVFGDAPARFAFTDEHLDDKEVLEPVSKVKEGNTTVTFATKDYSAAAMKELASFLLEKQLLTADKEADIMVRKEGSTPVVRLVVKKDLIQPIEASVIPVFGYWQHLIENRFPAFQKSAFWLTTTEFEDYKKIPALTQAELAEFETMMANDQAAAASTQTNGAETPAATAPAQQEQP